MCQENNNRSKEYSSTREAFDSLNVEEKLSFLAESTAKAFVDGVQEVVKSFSEAMEKGWPGEEEVNEEAPKKEPSKAAPRKSAAKRKTTKKTTSKKTTKKSTQDDKG